MGRKKHGDEEQSSVVVNKEVASSDPENSESIKNDGADAPKVESSASENNLKKFDKFKRGEN